MRSPSFTGTSTFFPPRYTVSVTVSQSSALPGIAAAAARRIDINVTYGAAGSVTLSGYRTSY